MNDPAVPDVTELRFIVEWLLEEERRRADFTQAVLDVFGALEERSNRTNFRDAMISVGALASRLHRNVTTIRTCLSWLRERFIIARTSRGGKRPDEPRGVANVYQLLRSKAHDHIRHAYRHMVARASLLKQPVDRTSPVPSSKGVKRVSSVLEIVNTQGVDDRNRPRRAVRARVSPELFTFASEFQDKIPSLRALNVPTVARILRRAQVDPGRWQNATHFIRVLDLEAARNRRYFPNRPKNLQGALYWFVVMNHPAVDETSAPAERPAPAGEAMHSMSLEHIARDVRVARRLGLVPDEWHETQALPAAVRAELNDYRHKQMELNQ